MAQMPNSRFQTIGDMKMLRDFPELLKTKRAFVRDSIGRLNAHAQTRSEDAYRTEMLCLRILWAQYRSQMRQYYAIKAAYPKSHRDVTRLF